MSDNNSKCLELNAVANLGLLIDSLELQGSGSKHFSTIFDIKFQLDRLERYMVAYNYAVQNNTVIPHWHEVRDNPELYPLNKEVESNDR